MESDEIEMTKEEFRMWVRAKVEENELIVASLKEQYSLLQSLLEKREKQAIHLRKVCESVATYEAIVKKQYSLLGWEYTDIDLDDNDDDLIDCANKTPEGSENMYTYGGRKIFINPKRQPVVVLTRLTPREINSFHRSKPRGDDSDVEYLSSSDRQRDSDFHRSHSSDKAKSHKRRQTYPMFEKPANTHVPPQACGTSSSKSKATKTPTGPASNVGNERVIPSAGSRRIH